LVVVFLLFGPYLSQFLHVGPHLPDVLKGRNAFWFQWGSHDLWFLVGTMMLLATIGVALREVIRWRAMVRPRRWSCALRLYDHVFVLTLVAGLVANLWFHTQRPVGYCISQFGPEVQTIWLFAVGIVGYSLAKGSRLVLWARQLCMMMSPAALIVGWQLLHLPVLPERHDALMPQPTETVQPVSLTEGSKPGIILILFDEWSYTRTYDNSRLRPCFANLAALSQQATVFHNAHSPGVDTHESIPAILRATEDEVALNGMTPGFNHDGRFVKAVDCPSIFTIAGCSQYRRIMVQWGFAVSLWMGDELDALRAYSCYPRSNRFIGALSLHLYNAAFYWTDPWTIFAYEKLKPRMTDPYTLDMYRQIRQDLQTVLRGPLEGVFAVVHYPLPHPPYLVKADGSYVGWNPDSKICANEQGYERNLACLDYTIGEIVRELKVTGEFDDCMLILTSDHSWRQDPKAADNSRETLTHVPLIVKLPGQREPAEVNADFRTFRLGQFIARGLRSNGRMPTIADLVNIPSAHTHVASLAQGD
jgi:hypothetical protein